MKDLLTVRRDGYHSQMCEEKMRLLQDYDRLAQALTAALPPSIYTQPSSAVPASEIYGTSAVCRRSTAGYGTRQGSPCTPRSKAHMLKTHIKLNENDRSALCKVWPNKDFLLLKNLSSTATEQLCKTCVRIARGPDPTQPESGRKHN
jgi:hypothetical protein